MKRKRRLEEISFVCIRPKEKGRTVCDCRRWKEWMSGGLREFNHREICEVCTPERYDREED